MRTKRIYHLSATAVWWAHIAWILLLVTGLPVLAWNRSYAIVELGLIGLTIVAQLAWKACPLTLLEEGLRVKHDPNYRRRAAFIEPLLRRLGIRRKIHFTPVHLGLIALAVLVVSTVLG